MTTNERFFGNLFDNVHITPGRLYLFSEDTLAKLKTSNPNNAYDDIIALITPLYNQFRTEVSNVDISQNLQKANTSVLDKFTINIRHSISSLEGIIARAIGGKEKPAFLEFFPHGLTEYDTAKRIEMYLLMARLDKVADKYSNELGTTITAELKGFKIDWDAAYDEQGFSKAEVSKNRLAKSVTRTSLELALMKAIHTVALQHYEDMDKCSSVFSFHLLYHYARHKHVHYTDKLQVGENKTIINRTLSNTVEIRAYNTGTNAFIKIWLAATETEEAPATAIIIHPGKSVLFSPEELGDLNNTFLRVINISDVNSAAYDVEVIG